MSEWSITSKVLSEGPSVYFKRLKKALGFSYKELTFFTGLSYHKLKRFESTVGERPVSAYELQKYINFASEKLGTDMNWKKVWSFLNLYNSDVRVWLADKPIGIRYIIYLLDRISYTDSEPSIGKIIKILNLCQKRTVLENIDDMLFYDPDDEKYDTEK